MTAGARERTVLVVDDEEGFHDLFRFCLQPLGFAVESARDGLEGLARFRGGAYDLIISDDHMPGMTGTEFLRRVRELRPGQAAIMLSSGSDQEAALDQRARDCGAAASFQKPFDLEELITAVNQLVETERGGPR